MREGTKMVVVLSLVGGLSGASLAGVYRYVLPLIEKNQRLELKRAIFEVLPQSVEYRKIKKKGEVIYEGLDKGKNLVGYAIMGKGPGYQGEIKLILGVAPDLREIKGIEVIEMVETPGLGARIDSPEFKERFRGLFPSPEVVLGKRGKRKGEVEALTGATISSRSVVRIVNEALKRLREALKEGHENQ